MGLEIIISPGIAAFKQDFGGPLVGPGPTGRPYPGLRIKLPTVGGKPLGSTIATCTSIEITISYKLR